MSTNRNSGHLTLFEFLGMLVVVGALVVGLWVNVGKRRDTALRQRAMADLDQVRSNRVISLTPDEDGVLRTAILNESRIDDDTIKSVLDLRHLEHLNLDETSITDASLPRLAELTQLRELRLVGTHITDRGIADLVVALPQLVTLDLRLTDVGNEGARSLAQLASLTSLHLNQTNVSDEGVIALATAPALAYLGLDFNNITDSALRSLTTSSSLTSVSVAGTWVTDDAIDRMRDARPNLTIGRYSRGLIINTGWKKPFLSARRDAARQWLVHRNAVPDNSKVAPDIDLSGDELTFRDVRAMIDLGRRAKRIDLHDSNLDDRGLRALAYLPALNSINLSNTRVSLPALSSLVRVGYYQQLNLAGTAANDDLLKLLSRHVQFIHDLNLANTHLTDAGLRYVSWIGRVESLTLDNTSVTNAGMAYLKHTPGLQRVSLRGTAVTNRGIAELKRKGVEVIVE